MKLALVGLVPGVIAQDLFLATRSDMHDAPVTVAFEMHSELHLQVPLPTAGLFKMLQSEASLPPPKKRALPTVTAHGMGDSCFNSGFEDLTRMIAKQTEQYAVCIPTGDDQGTDTDNGFF